MQITLLAADGQRLREKTRATNLLSVIKIYVVRCFLQPTFEQTM